MKKTTLQYARFVNVICDCERGVGGSGESLSYTAYSAAAAQARATMNDVHQVQLARGQALLQDWAVI